MAKITVKRVAGGFQGVVRGAIVRGTIQSWHTATLPSRDAARAAAQADLREIERTRNNGLTASALAFPDRAVNITRLNRAEALSRLTVPTRVSRWSKARGGYHASFRDGASRAYKASVLPAGGGWAASISSKAGTKWIGPGGAVVSTFYRAPTFATPKAAMGAVGVLLQGVARNNSGGSMRRNGGGRKAGSYKAGYKAGLRAARRNKGAGRKAKSSRRATYTRAPMSFADDPLYAKGYAAGLDGRRAAGSTPNYRAGYRAGRRDAGEGGLWERMARQGAFSNPERRKRKARRRSNRGRR